MIIVDNTELGRRITYKVGNQEKEGTVLSILSTEALLLAEDLLFWTIKTRWKRLIIGDHGGLPMILTIPRPILKI